MLIFHKSCSNNPILILFSCGLWFSYYSAYLLVFAPTGEIDKCLSRKLSIDRFYINVPAGDSWSLPVPLNKPCKVNIQESSANKWQTFWSRLVTKSIDELKKLQSCSSTIRLQIPIPPPAYPDQGGGGSFPPVARRARASIREQLLSTPRRVQLCADRWTERTWRARSSAVLRAYVIVACS